LSKKIDIIIISYNTCNLLQSCINSIYETSFDLVNNIIVVDNNSTDGTVEIIKKNYPDVKLICNEKNYGYAKAVNIGFNNTNSDLVLVSNSDVVYLENSIINLILTFKEVDNCGVCGPLQLFPNGTYQRSYGDIPSISLALKDLTLITHIQEKYRKLFPYASNKIKKVPYIDGAVMLIKRDAFNQVNGFDEDYFFYTEEADFCYRLFKRNYLIIHNPKSKVIHYRGATDNLEVNYKRIEMLISSKALFCKKNMSFNKAKFFMILEIMYSYNLWLIYWTIYLMSFGKVKFKNKKNTFKLFGEFWLKELTNLLKG